MSGKISKAKRFRILARDGFKCRYCGAAAPDVELRVDHFIARAEGGGSGEENLVTACFDCNAGKSDRKLTGLKKPIVKVANRRGAKTKASDPRNRSPHFVRKGDPNHHVLNPGAILETGKVVGEDQLVHLWCVSHQEYEWHFVRQWTVGASSGVVVLEGLPTPPPTANQIA